MSTKHELSSWDGSESIVPIVVAYVLTGFAGLVVVVTIWHEHFPIPSF